MYEELLMKKESEKSNYQNFKYIIHFAYSKRSWLWVGCVASVFLVLFNLFKIWYIKELINSIGSMENSNILVKYAIIVVILCILGTIATYLIRYSSGQYGYHIEKNIKSELVNYLSNLPISYLKKIDMGDLLTRLNNDVTIVSDFMVKNFSSFISQVLMCIGGVVFLLAINYKLAIGIVVSILLAMCITNKVKEKMKKAYSDSLMQSSEAYAMMYNSINGIDTIKSYNLEREMQNKIRQRFLSVFQSQIKAEKYSAMMLPSFISMKHVPKIMCFVLGGYMAIRGELQLGGLMAIIQTLDYLIQSAVNLPTVISNWSNVRSAVERIENIFSEKKEREDGKDYDISKREYVVEMKEVRFSYGEAPILKGIHFQAKKGEKIAFVGKSGCGKSTALDLICGFYENYQGMIKLFGHDLRTWDLQKLRKHISYVSQEAILFSGTIYDNIKFGNPKATEQEVVQAAKVANAHEFIREMENGYSTDVGERGCHLSGGQRQRICIARAILKGAELLIMDEPTSALDVDTENKVQSAIDKFSEIHTVIIVAHRLSTIKNANRILVFDEGQIVESGTNEELICKQGVYLNLYHKEQMN